jgi:hypothetical protein
MHKKIHLVLQSQSEGVSLEGIARLSGLALLDKPHRKPKWNTKIKSMSVYPSKVDLWLAAVLIVSPLLIFGMGIFTLSVNKPAALMAIAS